MKHPLPTDTACPLPGYPTYEEIMERRHKLNRNLGQLTHHWVAELNEGVKGTGTDRRPEDMGIVKED